MGLGQTMGMGNARESRRQPRATVRALQLLPPDSFPDPSQRALIQAKAWRELTIGEVAHPLLRDAAQRLKHGLPTPHKSTSEAAGRPIYEVRSRSGAAWRGAITLDDAGDPWLIWAAKHDEFHRQAQRVLASSKLETWLPRPVEYKLRAREEAAQRHVQWQIDATDAMLLAIAEVLESEDQRAEIAVPSQDRLPLKLDIELDHSQPSEHAEDDESMLIIARMDGEGMDDFVRFVVPALQRDSTRIEAEYSRNGMLELWITITRAELAQALAAVELPAEERGAPAPPTPMSALHYVDKSALAAHLVLGEASRGLCGQWFVPTRDEHANLPVCPRCEDLKPAAEQAVALIRRALASR